MLKLVMNSNKEKIYILFCILYVIQLSQCKVASRRDEANANPGTHAESDAIADGSDGSKENQQNLIENGNGAKVLQNKQDGDSDLHSTVGCWISLNEQSFFKKMNQLEQKYKDINEAYAKDIDTQKLNERMIHGMVQTRAIAERTLQKFEGNSRVIPAGLNLGNYCMMRMPGSMLFFYRLKLRNDTRFTVNYIHNDVKQLMLTLRLSLNDLHLVGEYERALTSKEDPSRLYYRPNKGEVEYATEWNVRGQSSNSSMVSMVPRYLHPPFLLKDVKYKVEGRYRLLNDRLHIEHIISKILPMPILMRYTTDKEGKSVPMEAYSLKDYLDRMQIDLDRWLKDYFNDFLMLYATEEIKTNKKVQEFQSERTILLNKFCDEVLVAFNSRSKMGGADHAMPDFRLTAANGMEVKLYDGTVYGLDTMYRRSVTTGKLDGEVRNVNADIGFSGLKAQYRYDTFVKTGMPPVSGVFVLNADDVTAHMDLRVVGYQPAVSDLRITYQGRGKPESLIIEGPANRIIANFNHLLEHHIISIMSSTLIMHIRSLSSLTKCDPRFPNNDGKQPDNHDDDNDPTESNNDGPKETPDNTDDDNEHTENIDDGLTEAPENSDDDNGQPDKNDDGPTEAPDNNEHTDNSDDEPTETPENYDNGSTELPDNDDDEPENPNYSDDNESTGVPPDSDDIPNNDNTKDKKPEYAFVRKESIELEIPPRDGAANGESYKIDHNETFSLSKLN